MSLNPLNRGEYIIVLFFDREMSLAANMPNGKTRARISPAFSRLFSIEEGVFQRLIFLPLFILCTIGISVQISATENVPFFNSRVIRFCSELERINPKLTPLKLFLLSLGTPTEIAITITCIRSQVYLRSKPIATVEGNLVGTCWKLRSSPIKL